MSQSNTLFIIKNNTATPVDSPSFKDLGIAEVQHLQEWIRKYPQMLGEKLLVIQKEFRGFAGTNERLDLLALDKDGNLVVIENKRDDSGADVTWQALKYVSYCSTLTPEGIERIFQKYLDEHFPGENAEQKMCEFFGQNDISSILDQGDQRMILVAANFRKEVTSTVMWLFDRGIRIKCIKVTPYKHGEDIFVNTEQIIPVKDVEEYLIQLAQVRQAKNIATAEANVLGSRWTFSELNIPEGAELIFEKDKTKKCFVVGEQSVKYEGEIFPSLAALANHLWQELGLNGSPRGTPQHFCYNGTLLSKLRKGAEQ